MKKNVLQKGEPATENDTNSGAKLNKVQRTSPAEVPTRSAEAIAIAQDLLCVLTGVEGRKVANQIHLWPNWRFD